MSQDFSYTGKYHISTEFAGIHDMICRPGHLSSTSTLHLQLYGVTHFTSIKNLQPLQFGYCTWSYCHNILIIMLFYRLKCVYRCTSGSCENSSRKTFVAPEGAATNLINYLQCHSVAHVALWEMQAPDFE